jgi:hypothetical protein
MTTEGGGALILLADFLGQDDTGIKVTTDGYGDVKIEVDSTAYPSKSIRVDPDTADELAQLIHLRAAEARARS